MTTLSMIVAVSKNGVIGINNQLPWHLPEDLKHFKALTMGHHIIMGRNTFESLGRLLPGRISVVVTRNPDYRVQGAMVVHSLQEAIANCREDSEIFIIGGAQLYSSGIFLADKLYMTEVDIEVDGDTRMPEIDFTKWKLESCEQHESTNGLRFAFKVFTRNTR